MPQAEESGTFKEQYQSRAGELIKQLESSNVTTKVTIADVVVESIKPDSAVVLVVARTELTNSGLGEQQPKLWRLAITVNTDAGQLKTSNVEFV